MDWWKLGQVRVGISRVTSVFREQPAEPVHRTAWSLLAPRFDRVSRFSPHDVCQLQIHFSIEWNKFIVAFLGGWEQGEQDFSHLLMLLTSYASHLIVPPN